jgi:hypothetical protein
VLYATPADVAAALSWLMLRATGASRGRALHQPLLSAVENIPPARRLGDWVAGVVTNGPQLSDTGT